jgi:tRNA A37 threonylcarbamoyladenosine synthetase subunit TsaC/SUA5/YrdC
MTVIQLGPEHYRRMGRRKIKLSLFEAASFAIASTWATRPKRKPIDPAKADRQFNAMLTGLIWLVTHR